MRYPLGLVYDSAKHLLAGRLRCDPKFAICVSLDPLGGCGSSCKKAKSSAIGVETAATDGLAMLSVEQCLAALEECAAPIVSICGAEPLEYPEIQSLVREILARGKHLFLCTDGTLIRRRLHMIPPYTNFFWNVRLDGTEAVHDERAGRPGLYREALDGVKAAKNAGFFVVATTTIYPDTDITDVAGLYQKMHEMHVDGYLFSPAYSKKSIGKAESAAFHQKMQARFREVSSVLGGYNLMISPVYLEYLRGERELDCCAWGSPVCGPRGWSAPCSLLNEGYVQSYAELRDKTAWEDYGRGVNPQCETCLCHAGFESAALMGANSKAGDIWKMLAWQFGGNLGEKRESAGCG
jgi:hopanoid biosynthesis associated radical SAM protein HpnH